VAPPRTSSRTSRDGSRSPRLKPGVKREQIVDVAIDYFGRYGYPNTKWADVAKAVGIGSTALYHYFESKQHCLYEIIDQGLQDFRDRFDRVVSEHDDWNETLVALLVDLFDLDEREILRLRVLVAEQGLVAIHSELPREEAARTSARSHMGDIEFVWGTFLARGMQQGVIPESDPKLLARAVLGLYNSIWHWYRPGGKLTLAEVGRFYVSRQLALLGSQTSIADDKFPVAA
jgi:TetR/AcrR family transcriptional regulator, cholesterol catabolism regulator